MLLAILIVMVEFMFLPLESAYLIPAVPLVMIVLGLMLSEKQFAGVCLALLLSPWVLGVAQAGESGSPSVQANVGISLGKIQVLPFSGMVSLARASALKKFDSIMDLKQLASTLPADSVLVCGWWWVEIRALGLDLDNQVEMIEWLGAQQAEAFRERGRPVFCAPGQAKYNEGRTGLKLDPGCELR
jgi:hypothetical protein